jgi:hypothetical protein
MRQLVVLSLLAAAACTEQVTAPGSCPNFCPTDSIAIRDTIFTTIIERDSSFRGYVPAYSGEAMTVADLPGIVDSRGFFVLSKAATRVQVKTGDTTTTPIIPDSVRFRLSIMRRDTLVTNLRLRLYHVPITSDSTSTFASLDAAFNGPVVDSVNVSAVLASPVYIDTVTADSLERRLYGDTTYRDGAGHILALRDSGRIVDVYFHFDTLQAPVVEADSGQLGYGVRVAGDSPTSIAIGSTEGGRPPALQRFFHHTIPDTVSTQPDSVVSGSQTQSPVFDSFVFDPPSPALDTNLTVGGVPSARALLRVAMPAFLHDSIDVVRATLLLVPVNAVQGVPADSFRVVARNIVTDLGGKSPLGALTDTAVVHIGSSDTVTIELTDIVRAWSLDTTLTTAFILGQVPEASSYTEIRFYSSRAPAFRPGLHVTYVKRFRFGEP